MCKLDLVSHGRQELRKAVGMELGEVSRSVNEITKTSGPCRCLEGYRVHKLVGRS